MATSVYSNKARTSPMWQLFKRLSPGLAKCCLCRKTLSFKSSITNLKRHLLLKHGGSFETILKTPLPYPNVRSEAVVKTLIAQVRTHPCLWDTRSDSYGDAQLQLAAWNSIASRVYPTEEQSQVVPKLIERFNRMRNQYFSNRRCGYHDELSFLAPLLNENSVTFGKEIHCIEIEDDVKEEDAPNVHHTTPNVEEPSSFQPAAVNEPKFTKPLNYPTPMPSPFDCKLKLDKVDEDTLFLLSLVDEVRQVPNEYQINFKAELMLAVGQLVKGYTNKKKH